MVGDRFEVDFAGTGYYGTLEQYRHQHVGINGILFSMHSMLYDSYNEVPAEQCDVTFLEDENEKVSLLQRDDTNGKWPTDNQKNKN